VAAGVLRDFAVSWPSPALTDEAIPLFLAWVGAAGAGAAPPAAAEHEASALLRVPIDAALAALAGGAVRNGPLIVALQWLALNRGRLAEIARAGTISREHPHAPSPLRPSRLFKMLVLFRAERRSHDPNAGV